MSTRDEGVPPASTSLVGSALVRPTLRRGVNSHRWRRARITDPEYGRICGCGDLKDEQALRCRACYADERRNEQARVCVECGGPKSRDRRCGRCRRCADRLLFGNQNAGRARAAAVAPVAETDRRVIHGEVNTYVIHSCRCAKCRAAWAAYHRERRRTRTVRTHNANGYTNRCRCVVCREAHAARQRIRRANA